MIASHSRKDLLKIELKILLMLEKLLSLHVTSVCDRVHGLRNGKLNIRRFV